MDTEESSKGASTPRPFLIANNDPGRSRWQRGAAIRAHFGEGATERVLYNGEDLAWRRRRPPGCACSR